jgi:hypothetical protein
MKTPRKKQRRILLKTFVETHEESLVPNRKSKFLWKPCEQNYVVSNPLMNLSFTNGTKSF